mmetsp:Transcript_47466/g.34745  ORF Transcript_47466/g.34745 Transcript_47466/m.34745 type:complete len:108 (-) Transcript_47466:375-698(-)
MPSLNERSLANKTNTGATIRIGLGNNFFNTWTASDEHGFYYFNEMVFHSPSEHTMDGKHFDVEMQIWSTDPTGTKKAVLAAFFQRNKDDMESAFINSLNLNNLTETI